MLVVSEVLILGLSVVSKGVLMMFGVIVLIWMLLCVRLWVVVIVILIMLFFDVEYVICLIWFL